MNDFKNRIQPNRTVVHTLAIAGFAALIGIGMWGAVYSARYVPAAVNGAGAAVVYLGSILIPAEENNSSLISTSTIPTEISFGESISTSTENTIQDTQHQITPTAGNRTSGVYQISGQTSRTLYGLPDLALTITNVGYLTTTSADSFIASSTVPSGSRPAVAFTVKNIGTNASGQWRFSAVIPTQTAYVYQSQSQQSLLPGESIDYVLGFDQANKGIEQTISISVNFDHMITESDSGNNNASAKVTIVGP